jgi:hypothetical protein
VSSGMGFPWNLLLCAKRGESEERVGLMTYGADQKEAKQGRKAPANPKASPAPLLTYMLPLN